MKTKTIAITLLMAGLLTVSCKKKVGTPPLTQEEILNQQTEQTKSKLFGKTVIILMTATNTNFVSFESNQNVDSLAIDASGNYKLTRTPYRIAIDDTLVEYNNGKKFTGKNWNVNIYSQLKTKYTGIISVTGNTVNISTYGNDMILDVDPTNISTMYNTSLKQSNALIYSINNVKYVKPLAIR